MKQIDELWQARVHAYTQELRRYFKYIFNDHLLFVLIFGGGAAIYYYSEWVRTLTSEFPVGVIMALVLALVLTTSPIQTLLKEADIVFLLPLEINMNKYFNKGIRLSFMSQACIGLFVLAAFMPMYVQVTGHGFNMFFYLLAIVLLLKYWNLALHWLMLKANDRHGFFFDWFTRFVFNIILLYFVLEEASIAFIGLTLLIMITFTIYFYQTVKEKSLKWELLIEKEQGRMQTFYQAANMFTDVPHLKGQMKRRKWLDPLFASVPYGNAETYRFLFARTIVRSKEYSGLLVRLTVIGGFFLFLNDNLYFSLASSLLFIYLTGFQLFPLLRHHELKIWTAIYPVAPSQKRSAFLQLLLKVLLTQAILFGIIALVGSTLINGLIVGGVSIIFAYLFAKLYGPNRIAKMEQQTSTRS